MSNENGVTSMSPREAYTFLQDHPEASLIDIRSSMEYFFVGHPVGSTHIAWIDEPDWKIDLEFPDKVLAQMSPKASEDTDPKSLPVVLICRSGKRTLDAGEMLLEEGFSQVIHIDEGFEGERDESYHRSTVGGWRFHGLPWEQC